MKQYNVLVNITVATTIEVSAESKEQAETIAQNWIGDDYEYYAGSADMFVESVVVETKEKEE